MKHCVLSGVLLLLVCALSCCEMQPLTQTQSESAIEIPPEIQKILPIINGVSAYEVPDLGLQRDVNYAMTPQGKEPFRHVKPYKQHFLEQLEYTGPGRAIPEPEHVDTVRIGFIGPIESTVSVATGGKSHEEILGVKMLEGSQLAIEQANARGGYLKRSIPFELIVHNDNGLWGASGNEIIDMAYKENCWAILGTIDGANSHIAIRVALKAEIPMINTGDTDPTLVETNIPWVFRNIGDDRQMGYLLVDYLYGKLKLKRVGIIRSSNRYGRFGVREVRDGSRRVGHPIILEMAYQLGINDFSLQLERLQNENVQAVVHWGNALEGAKILNQMRKMGMKQPYFTCDRCLSEEFLDMAGENAEGVICAYPWNPKRQNPAFEQFLAQYRARFDDEPETYAAHGYDGMNLLIWAIQVAGLNRARIRDVLAYRTTPWQGVTGEITFSAVRDDMGEVFLAERKNGKWHYYSRDDLNIPRENTPLRDRNKESISGG